MSTNKVYGDNPNKLKLIEKKTRFELNKTNKYYNGIDETMSIDDNTHSLFGVSKSYGDLSSRVWKKFWFEYCMF